MNPKKQPILFGKYFLLDRINIGGMAEVWRGKTFGAGGFERLVAIKRILPNIAEDDEFKTMFIDEAKISVQLTHSNIAQVHDLGQIGNSLFIAMEYIPGKDVRAIFDRSRKKGEPAPIPLTCYVISKLCEAMDYAHRKKDGQGRDMNIVHRDVSPQNVLISFDGEVKIIDFGIAKAAGKATKTQAGILKGKFGYMSPEQIRGLPLDRRSDIFAIGVCLYELLTGERLFVGESDFSVLEKVRRADVLAPSTYNRRVPDGLERVVLKALAKDVDVRYQYASELFKDLQPFVMMPEVFTQRDLAQYMKSTFVEDVDREKQRLQEYAELKLAPTGTEDTVQRVTRPRTATSTATAAVQNTDEPTAAYPPPQEVASPARVPAGMSSTMVRPPTLPKLTPANPQHVSERDLATQLVQPSMAPGAPLKASGATTEPPEPHEDLLAPSLGAREPNTRAERLGQPPVEPPAAITPTFSDKPPRPLPPEVDLALQARSGTPTSTESPPPAVSPETEDTQANHSPPPRALVPATTPLDRPPSPHRALNRPVVDMVRPGLSAPIVKRTLTKAGVALGGLALGGVAVVGVVLLLAGIGIGYLLHSPRSAFVQIDIKPRLAKTKLTVNGHDYGVQESWPVVEEVTPGTVNVKISAEGYGPWLSTVDVPEGKRPTTLVAELKHRQESATLVVVTDPETALVKVNGAVVHPEGTGGFVNQPVPVDREQTVEAAHKGFRTQRRKITADSADQPAIVYLKLEPIDLQVRVRSNPSGASIFLGEKQLGTTPAQVRLPPDTKAVVLRKKCFAPRDVPVPVPLDASDIPELNADLTHLPGCR